MMFGYLAALVALSNPIEIEGCLVGRIFFEQGSTQIIEAPGFSLEALYANVERMLTPNAWVVLETLPESQRPAAMRLARRRTEQVRRGLNAHPVRNPIHTSVPDGSREGIDSYVRRSVAVLVYMPRVEWQRRYGNVLC